VDPTKLASAVTKSRAVRTIVVPMDGSVESEAVLPYVKQIAEATQAGVILFTAIYFPTTWMEFAAPIDLDKESEAARTYLKSKQQQLKGISAEVEVAQGPPSKAILDCAEARGADLIAMTTHGRSGFSRLAWGSVADKVLHSAQTPLLVVRPDEGGIPSAPAAPPIEKILVPLDGSELSRSVLPLVAALAQALGSSILLTHSVASLWAGEPGAFVPTLHDRTLRESKAAAKRLLARVATDLEPTGLKVTWMVTVGDPVGQIVRLAETESVGLIAMSTHGRSGVGRWVIGSVAEAVVRRTHVPSLLVRPQPASNQQQGEAGGP